MLCLVCTSPKFEGEMRIIYGDDMLLQVVNVQGTTMDEQQIGYLIRLVPVRFTDNNAFLSAFGKASLTVVSDDYEVTFDEFWDAYGHKVNRNRCEPLWGKLTKPERVRAFVGVKIYLRYLQRVTRAKADPEKYLKDKYWLTEWSKL